MKRWTPWAEAIVWLAGSGLLWQIVSTAQTRELVRLHEAAEAYSADMLAPLVASACREGDDLSLTRLIAQTSRIPEVHALWLRGPDGHLQKTNPLQLAQWSCPRELAAVEWATPPLRRAQQAQGHWLLLFGGIFLMAGALRVGLALRQERRRQAELEASRAMIAVLEREGACAKERLAQSRQAARIWAARVLREGRTPGLLLDAEQRVVAASPEFPAISPGTSWQDIPWLRESGEMLAKSLDQPGRSIVVAGSDGHSALTIESLPGLDQKPAGSWIVRDSPCNAYNHG